MNDPVTLPREVVEQVRGALAYVGAGNSSENPNLAQSTCRQAIWKLDHALRAELEQPDHSEQNLNMIPAGWKLVPDEPTCGMVLAGEHSMKQHDFFRLDAGYRAMLAAAPQHPTTEQSSAVEQPQGEQEPVAWIENVEGGIGYNPYHEAARKLPDGVRFDLYVHPQNLRCKSTQARLATLWGYVKAEPLTDEQIAAATGARPGTPTWLVAVAFARAIEAAHNIK